MNTYRYMIIDGKARPMQAHWEDEVPMHHIAHIEALAGAQSLDLDNVKAVIRNGKKFIPCDDLAKAIHEKVAGRYSAVCFFYEEKDEHFGPTGNYVIFE